MTHFHKSSMHFSHPRQVTTTMSGRIKLTTTAINRSEHRSTKATDIHYIAATYDSVNYYTGLNDYSFLLKINW